MRRFVIRALVVVFALFLWAQVVTADGVKNNGAKYWRVAYHKNNPHPKTDDHALRIRVVRPDSTSKLLTGTLKHYVFVENSGNPRYRKRGTNMVPGTGKSS